MGCDDNVAHLVHMPTRLGALGHESGLHLNRTDHAKTSRSQGRLITNLDDLCIAAAGVSARCAHRDGAATDGGDTVDCAGRFSRGARDGRKRTLRVAGCAHAAASARNRARRTSSFWLWCFSMISHVVFVTQVLCGLLEQLALVGS